MRGRTASSTSSRARWLTYGVAARSTRATIPAVRSRTQKELLTAGILRHLVRIEAHTQTRRVWNRQHAVRIEAPTAGGDRIDEGRAGQILHQVGVGKCGGELQIGGEADRGVPAVRNEAHAVFLRHPGDAPLLADAADFGDVRLHDVEGAALRARAETTGGGSALRRRRSARASAAQLDVIVERIGLERFLEPCDVVVGQHLGGVAAPICSRSARRHRWRRRRPSAGSRRRPLRARRYDGFVEARHCVRPNGPQPILNARNPCAFTASRCSAQRLRLLHQQRGIGLDARRDSVRRAGVRPAGRWPGRACPTARYRCR